MSATSLSRSFFKIHKKQPMQLCFRKQGNKKITNFVNTEKYLSTAILKSVKQTQSTKLLRSFIKKSQILKTPNWASTYDGLVNKKCLSSEQKKNIGRHQFPKEVEGALIDQIKEEIKASFTYLSMAVYYGRTDVALPGCQGFFMNMHKEELEHAIIFLNYVLMRGGQVTVPEFCVRIDEWKDLSKTFEEAALMESCIKEKLQNVVVIAEEHNDWQLADFITTSFLKEQNESICTMARLNARSKMVSSDVGEYLFDKHLYESFVERSKDNLMYVKDISNDTNNQKVYK